MAWTDEWVGLRYAPRGRGPAYDCWGLYRALVAARTGVRIPGASWQARRMFRPAPDGEVVEGDALLFRMAGQRLHIGYALDGRDMLHVEQDQTMSLLERHDTARWRDRLEGTYRIAA